MKTKKRFIHTVLALMLIINIGLMGINHNGYEEDYVAEDIPGSWGIDI